MKKSSIEGIQENRGITLIALVITIIILLILAGISIAMLTGENGLLTKATESKTRNEEGEIKEEIGLAWNAVQTDGIVNSWDLNKKAEELQAELGKKDSSATVTVDGDNLNVSYRGYDATINTVGGGITEFAKTNISISLTISGTPVAETDIPVPDGFSHTEGTKDTGYVIKDGSGNEFVWVPVDKDQKISLKVTSEEDITGLKLYDPTGTEINLGTVSGKSYNNTNIAPTINGGYKAEVTTASGTVNKTLVVRSLYAMDTFLNISITDDYFLSDEWINKVKGYYGYPETKEELYSRMGGVTTDEQFVTTSKQRHYQSPTNYTETEDYATKVNTAGGFYIGRYEATYENNKAVSKKGTTAGRTSSSTSLANGMVWNYISQTDALAKANEYDDDKTGITSSLLTGSAWDRTLGWLVNTNNKKLSQVAVDSKDWGNYSDDTFTTGSNQIKTGEFGQTKANNIYDLAGNMYEWTTEAYNTTLRVGRRRRLQPQWLWQSCF